MAFSSVAQFLKLGIKNVGKGTIKNPPKILLGFMIMPVRNFSCLEVTKNISLISNEKKNPNIIIKDLKLIDEQPHENPMVILLSWMMAKKQYTKKYVNIWIERGFDVLHVSCNPWQFLWPIKGTQVVAGDILKFLEQNYTNSPMIIHGFSVGGYLMGEVMVKANENKEKYQQVLNRFVGQIWDSVVDVTEIHKGVPPAVFPHNKVMAKALEKYILYHMKTFDKVATSHYVRSSQMFHTNIIHAPALFLVSATDPIGNVTSNQRVRENWESMGMKVSWKLFEKSPHVGHFRKYPKEYIEEIDQFLISTNLNIDEQKDKLNQIKIKQ